MNKVVRVEKRERLGDHASSAQWKKVVVCVFKGVTRVRLKRPKKSVVKWKKVYGDYKLALGGVVY